MKDSIGNDYIKLGVTITLIPLSMFHCKALKINRKKRKIEQTGVLLYFLSLP